MGHRRSTMGRNKMATGAEKRQSGRRFLFFAASVFAFAGYCIVFDPTGEPNEARRNLSVALFSGSCHVTPAEPPEGTIESAFFASYPGSGARLAWQLVEGLTGLVTGDEHGLNGHTIGKAVTIKTHYPHPYGAEEIASVGTDRVRRAVLLLRNPRDAIPAFHNFLWEREHDLPAHSARAPVEEWIKWRDENFVEQMNTWALTADYWLSRYGGEQRLVVGFEGLISDERRGPRKFAKDLAAFLDGSDGVTTIDEKSIPCVWEKTVRYRPRSAPRGEEPKLTFESIKKTQSEARFDVRPYTEAQLDVMVDMITALQKKHRGDRRLNPWLRTYKTDAECMKKKLLGEDECEDVTPPAKPQGKPLQTAVAEEQIDSTRHLRSTPNVQPAGGGETAQQPSAEENQSRGLGLAAAGEAAPRAEYSTGTKESTGLSARASDSDNERLLWDKMSSWSAEAAEENQSRGLGLAAAAGEAPRAEYSTETKESTGLPSAKASDAEKERLLWERMTSKTYEVAEESKPNAEEPQQAAAQPTYQEKSSYGSAQAVPKNTLFYEKDLSSATKNAYGSSGSGSSYQSSSSSALSATTSSYMQASSQI